MPPTAKRSRVSDGLVAVRLTQSEIDGLLLTRSGALLSGIAKAMGAGVAWDEFDSSLRLCRDLLPVVSESASQIYLSKAPSLIGSYASMFRPNRNTD